MCLLLLLIALFGRHVRPATAPRTLRRRNNPVVRHRAKPPWAKAELILLKARMPAAGCRALADLFNRRHAPDMTVSKSYVADVMKRHALEIRIERRRMRRQRPGASPRNRVWALDLTGKTDQHGRLHMILGIIDHGSRFALELARIADKRALTVLGHLVRCVLRHGRPRFLRTDNEAIFTSFVFRIGPALLGIRHQRTEPHCPWQNGRIERLFGTLKAPLDQRQVEDAAQLDNDLKAFRLWYNHVRPHQNLDGRTPREVWCGIDPLARRLKIRRWFSAWDGLLLGERYLL